MICIESFAELIQSIGGHDGIAADANAEAIGHFEKVPRYDAGLIAGAQELAELVDGAMLQARKDNRSPCRAKNFEIGSAIEKSVQSGAIGAKDFLSASANLRQMIERNYTQ